MQASDPILARSVQRDASFQYLFYQSPLPMWVFDNDTLSILAVNDAAVEKYGWSREEFLLMSIEDIRPPDELSALRAYRRKVMREPTAGLNTLISWRHKTKSGELIDVESTWHEIPWEDRNAVLVVNVDRSGQRQAEDRAREQANLLDLAADAILVRDLDRRVLFWNRGAERLYGWSTAEVLGRRVTDFQIIPEAVFSVAEQELLKAGSWTGQIDQRRKNGETVVVNSRWTLVRDERGQPKSVLVINTDVTETKKLEAQFLRAQRLEAIGTLASGIAHDLNNILAPILMSVELLRRTLKGTEGGEKLLNIIQGSADRGAGIVKQVLTFARGVEGERVLLQPKHLVSELAKIMSQTFPRNIDIQTHFPTELWTINGDATQLHQVLLNLCVNARDAMPRGGQLSIFAENVEVDQHFAQMNPGAQLGPHVAFRVSDTGTGITPEVMDKIFDPFFTTKEVGKGTGLGLATVMGIVKSHGGFLTVQSEMGVGTSFKVFLPAARDASVIGTEQDAEPIARGQGELVLVVDDEMAIREALVQTLQANGYRAYTAEDGSDALALYFQRRDEIEVVLTDISMGQMDGVTLIRNLRKVNPLAKIIASSGHFQKESTATLSALGVKVLLDKPYTAERLLRALQSMLRD